MGGAVSSGRDNSELVDNLMGGNYIRTRAVERVFRVLDRADFMTPDSRDQAHKDQAWRNGPLHLSAPCIYSEVLEALELKPGLSFLNVGSGTGYFSTMVGLLIGSGGINHGVEVHPYVHEYAVKKQSQFNENSPTLDEFDYCEPKFYCGNGLCLAPLQTPYDRVYCGAGCPKEYKNYFRQLIKVGGILVMPLNDNLVQVRRTADQLWESRNLLNVSFAALRVPAKAESADLITLDEQCPPRLQVLARAVVRYSMRQALISKNPQLREPPPVKPRPQNACPRRICIPIEDDSDVEGLNALHDLDNESGANEMNALLSLVLSMGQNRVAGALRFDSLDSPTDSSEEEAGDDDRDGDDGDDPTDGPDGPDGPEAPPVAGDPRPVSRSITFEFQHRSSRDSSSDGIRTPPLPGGSDDGIKRRNGINGVPSEVEICLSKAIASTSRLDMDWQGIDVKSSSDEESTETSKEQKRQKLDSGIGEGGTSSGSSPGKIESKSDESETEAARSTSSENLTDDEENIGARRRRQKRSRRQLGPQSTSSTECEDSCGSGSGAGGRRRCKRRARGRAGWEARPGREARPLDNGRDARRVRLSIMMKRGVKELPLPYALKKYVNLGRCFEF